MTGSRHLHAVGRADPPVEIELERQADQGGDWVRQLRSEVVALDLRRPTCPPPEPSFLI